MTRDLLVVLLEDDEGLRDALALVLRSRGYRVAPAASAGEASNLLEEESPHAVLADLGLPDRSGPELVSALRAAAPDARLVVLTGHQGGDLRRSCLEAGADAFLVKPISGSDLVEVLEG